MLLQDVLAITRKVGLACRRSDEAPSETKSAMGEKHSQGCPRGV